MKTEFVSAALTLALCGCSQRDLNLPAPSPMPERRVVESVCPIQFNDKMHLAEIAIAAYEMQERCGYDKRAVENSARIIFTDRSDYTN